MLGGTSTRLVFVFAAEILFWLECKERLLISLYEHAIGFAEIYNVIFVMKLNVIMYRIKKLI